MKKQYVYEDFKKDTRVLINAVKEYKPEAILAIARGGCTLSHAMAEGLNIRDLQSVRTELYDKECKREHISLFGECNFSAKRVLVLDDIADSGETLAFIMKYLEDNFKDIEFRSATLFYKKTSIYEPTYWVNEANEWIEFFWEKDFLTEKENLDVNLEVILEEKSKIVILKPNAELSKDDFLYAKSLIDPFVTKVGKLNGIVIYTKDFPGWDSFSAFVMHMEFIKDHHKKIKRLAFVTDSFVGEMAQKVGSHFVSAEIKNFDYDALDDAKRWIGSSEH